MSLNQQTKDLIKSEFAPHFAAVKSGSLAVLVPSSALLAQLDAAVVAAGGTLGTFNWGTFISSIVAMLPTITADLPTIISLVEALITAFGSANVTPAPTPTPAPAPTPTPVPPVGPVVTKSP